MIIDLILDRKDGIKYNPYEFYSRVLGYRDLTTKNSDEIARAMDYGTEYDVRTALKLYIDDEGYNPEIKEYIDSVSWIE